MFLFFIASMPFEPITLPVLQGFLSPAKISGLLFFGVCMWYPKRCFPRPAPAVLWFWGYLAVYLVLGLFIVAELRGQMRGLFLTMLQLVTFFWVGSSLLQDIRLARQSLFTFGASCALLALGTLLGLPGFAETVRTNELGGQRAAALGYNPNSLAAVMALAAIMLIGLLLDNTKRRRGRAWLLACLTAPVLALLVATSSRGGLLAFVVGVLVLIVPLAPSRRRLAGLALGFFGLIAFGSMVASDPVLVYRLTRTYQEGNVAGRDVIFGQAVEQFLERPILGWGPIEFLYELGSRLHLPVRDPHNMYLWLLLEVGLVGTPLFLTGVWLCARAAWKSRTGPEGVLPLSLIVAITIVNFSSSWLARKPMWLVFAVALASPAVSAKWKLAVSAGNGRATGRTVNSPGAAIAARGRGRNF